MKIFMQDLELAFSELNDANYSDEVYLAFDNMLSKLKEDERGYVHFKKVEEFYFDGLTNDDKQTLKKEINKYFVA
ncbi:hypothetical protein ACSFCR_07455 [Enterococcus faecalis]|uniref:hypothetical protein n=1 Tax=Enterococcus faecalis TaxID=1351 RepID=UPI003ED99856